jgi:hypothetical protein
LILAWVFVSLLAWPVHAAWYGLTETEPAAAALELLQSTPTELTLRVALPGFEVTEPEDGYVKLEIPGEGFAGLIGEPQIPTVTRLIRAPFGADVQVDVVTDYETLPLSALTGAARVMPVQPSIPKLPGARERAVFTIHEAAYQRGVSVFDAPAGVIDDALLRGYRVLMLQVRPFNYNPAAETVDIATELTVRVRFVGGDWAETAYQSTHYAEPRTWAIARNVLINFDAFEDRKGLPPFTANSYVVLGTADALQLPIVKELIDWKAQRGFTVVPVSLAEAGNTAENVRAYMRQAYNNWERPPAYLLLLGDTNLVPCFTGSSSNSASDTYFGATAGGDYLPDLGVGRLPYRTEAQLKNMIRKILNYEQNLWAGGDKWTHHATFMASNDQWQVSQGTHNYVISEILKPAGFQSTKVYSHQGGTTQQAIDALNTGPTIHAYSGHGGVDYWADGPILHQSDVRALTNVTTPLILSHACVTGSYDANECFGETWLRVPKAGLAFWGASNNSYWDEDDVIERAMFEGWFRGDGTLDALPWTRGMLDYSMVRLYEQYNGGGLTHYYFDMYNLMGDPEVMLYSAEPMVVDADLPASLEPGASSFTVGAPGCPNAMVGVTLDGEMIGVAYADANGEAAVELADAVQAGDELTVTVTGQNLVPYIGTLSVEEPSTDDDDNDNDDATDDDDDNLGDDDDNDDDDSGGCS